MNATLYANEARYELVRLARLPMYVTLTLALPVMLYVFYGVLLSGVAGGPAAVISLVAWACYGIMGASLYGFGVALAVERGLGWMELKRASPIPPSAYFAAKLAACLAFAFAITAILLAIGTAFAGVRLDAAATARLFAALVGGGVPFCALGLVIGYLASASSAPAVANVVYLPMTFLSGILVPVESIPSFLRWLPPLLPPYHMARLAAAAAGVASDGQNAWHVAALSIFTAACLAVALVGARRAED